MKTYFSLKNIINPDKQGTARMRSGATLTPRDVLLSDIDKTREALENAYLGFDNVTDPDLIDCYIYEIDATLKRYRFLLSQAERMQLCDHYTECEAFDRYNGDDYDFISAVQ